MRRFLYVSPYFPPMARVGALRPLKFARHLPDHGWAPFVLSDVWPDDPVSQPLLDLVPDTTTVMRDYGRRSARHWEAYRAGTLPVQTRQTHAQFSEEVRGLGLLFRHRDGRRRTLGLPSEEKLPLGIHAADMPHAIARGEALLREHPECELIMVNADPYAGLLVGAKLKARTGRPLVLDLRDPWAYCQLRRPLRPPPQRAWTDRLERRAFEAADAIILNTETALGEYRRRYPEFDARLHCIRNASDAELIGAGSHPGFDRFTALFLGSLRRFVEGESLIKALSLLRGRGIGPDGFQLVITGNYPLAMQRRAAELGIADMIVKHDLVPYDRIGAVMDAADLLVSFSHRTNQRIPAKIYDYASSRRPMLVIADNPELAGLLERVGGAPMVGLDDVRGITEALLRAHGRGRAPIVDRDPRGLDAAAAAERLAGIFERVRKRAPDRSPSFSGRRPARPVLEQMKTLMKRGGQPEPDFSQLPVYMHPIELSQLLAIVEATAPRRVLEWGSGGSTRELLQRCPFIERFVSVEHNEKWYEQVKAKMGSDPRLDLHLVAPTVPEPNPPPASGKRAVRERNRIIREWHHRCEREPEILADYVSKPGSLDDDAPYDLVIVDGRARVFCLPEGFRLLRPGGVLVIHDAQREQYHPTIEALGRPVFLEPWEQGQICLLRKPSEPEPVG